MARSLETGGIEFAFAKFSSIRAKFIEVTDQGDSANSRVSRRLNLVGV